MKLTKPQRRLLAHARAAGGECTLYRAENKSARKLEELGLGRVRPGGYCKPNEFILSDEGRALLDRKP